MDVFDGLVDQWFREEEDGSVVFFPWGNRGRGYVIESPERHRRIRTFCRRYVAVSLPVVIGVGLGSTLVSLWALGGSGRALLLAAALLAVAILGSGIFYSLRIGRLLEGLSSVEGRSEEAEAGGLELRRWKERHPELYAVVEGGVGITLVLVLLLVALDVELDPRLLGLLAGAGGLLLVVVGRSFRR